MTQRRNDPDRVSNYFDRLLKGIGDRDSSFTDVDALTHDKVTHRFLFQEFKGVGERMHKAQKIAMIDLCARGSEFITVWCVRLRADGNLDFCDVATRMLEVLTPNEYCDRFRAWWRNEKAASDEVSIEPADQSLALTWRDITW